jgi:hypothetical protein
MRKFVHQVLFAVSPVFGVSISIAILQAAHVPFPPALSVEALPQWAVFAAVVYTSTSICMFVVSRLFGDAVTPGHDGSQPVA